MPEAMPEKRARASDNSNHHLLPFSKKTRCTIKLMPHLVMQLNEDKQSPLHVAASCGASPKVVHLLRKHCPLAVKWQDATGRTPLHAHLYECCGKGKTGKYNCDMGYLFDETSPEGVQDVELVQGPLLEVIKELCKNMSSDDMGLQDKFGHIPLEIAKFFECEATTLAVIKEAM